MQFTPNDQLVRFILEALFGPGECILQAAEAGRGGECTPCSCPTNRMNLGGNLVSLKAFGSLWVALVSGVGFVFGSTQIWIRKMALEGIFFIIISFSWALTIFEAQCTCPEGTVRGQEGTGMAVCSPEFHPCPPKGDICHNDYLVSGLHNKTVLLISWMNVSSFYFTQLGKIR